MGVHKPGSVFVKETRPCGNTAGSCAVTQIDTCKGEETRSCDMQHGRVESGCFEPNGFINRF